MHKAFFIRNYQRFIPFIFIFLLFLLPISIWLFQNLEEFEIYIFWNLLETTFVISLLTGIICSVLSYPLAIVWWINKKYRLFSNFLLLIVFSPVILGLLTRNYSWVVIFTGKFIPNIFEIQSLQYTFTAIIIVMVYIFIPFSFFIITQGFSSINISLIESAKCMGASNFEMLSKVIFPLTKRHFIFSILLVFISCLGYYITPEMIGGGKFDMVGNLIWEFIDLGEFSDASNVGISYLIILFPVVGCAFFYIYIRRDTFIR